MFALLLIKFNRLTVRARLFGGFSAGLILLLLAAIASYSAFCFDDLSRYASKNTLIYLHLDNRSAPDNFYKLKVTDAILKPFRMDDLHRRLLGSEIAVMCDEFNGQMECGLILQTKQAAGTRKFLTDNHLVFRQLDYGAFIVGQPENWLKTVKKSRNPFAFLKYQSALGRYGSLTLVLRQPQPLNNHLSKIISLADFGDAAKFNGSIANGGIFIKPAGFGGILPALPEKAQDKNEAVCDISIRSINGRTAAPLDDFMIRSLTASTSTLAGEFLGRRFSLCMNKTGSTGNLILDYDISLRSDRQLDDQQRQKLEAMLLGLASKAVPGIKMSYLTDGTKILEIRAKPENFAFESASGTRSIALISGKSLFYSNTASGLIIGNKAGIDSIYSLKSANNYLSIRINSMPQGQIKDILSDFSYISASNGQISLR